MADGILGTVKQQIGEASRFLRDYRANPEKYGSAKKTEDTSSQAAMQQSMAILQPMMLMMLFQMLLGMNGGASAQSGLSGFSSIFAPSSGGLDGGKSVSTAVKALASQADIRPAFAEEPVVPLKTPLSQLQTFLEATDDQITLEEFLDAWHTEGHTVPQLGQSLMYQLDKGNTDQLGRTADMIGALVWLGVLNPQPFMREDYLALLSDEKQQALSASLAETALRYPDGMANFRLMGFVLAQADEGAQPGERRLVTDILYRLGQNLAAAEAPLDLNSPVHQLFRLMGFPLTDTGQLAEATHPFELKPQFPGGL